MPDRREGGGRWNIISSFSIKRYTFNGIIKRNKDQDWLCEEHAEDVLGPLSEGKTDKEIFDIIEREALSIVRGMMADL